MKIAICDDLESDRNILNKFIDSFSQEQHAEFSISEFKSGQDFIRNLENEKYDLIFLDIYMNGEMGIDIAREIKELYPDIIIIFTTTSPDFAIESYSLNVEGYMVKPFTYEMFKKTFIKHYEKFKESMVFIVVNENKNPKKVFLKDIIFMEIYTRQCVLHTTGGDIDSSIRIGYISELLLKNSFYRISRNYMINFNYVENIVNTCVILKDNSKIPLPVRTKTKFMDAYSRYLWTKQSNI